ncbi:transposase, partial [Dictyobacter arantiisoli]|uniref:transposase n=1 Tax=Dictyobacter arantiisoli TaxID=2014874 RepID=UPI0011F06712
MFSQYGTPKADAQTAQEQSQQLSQQLESFLMPLLICLDAWLDARLVRTFLKTIAAMTMFRQRSQGLHLSELGSYLLNGSQAPAATKRIERLLHSSKWSKKIIEQFLWDGAEEKLHHLEEEHNQALCVWDGSVVEKPESQKTEGMCSVRSSKGARLKKQRKGVYNFPPGKPITVLGIEWIQLLIIGMSGTPWIATTRWWTRRGERASNLREQEQQLLLCVSNKWGRRVVHIFDRGYTSVKWLQCLFALRLHFVMRVKKRVQYLDQKGQEKKIWEIARGKRSWDKREIWDARKGKFIEMGVVAMPIWHAKIDKTIWLVVGRRGNDPLYLLTDAVIETIDQAWDVLGVYARRWQIEVSFRYEKSELAIESSCLRKWEHREKLLLMLTLVYAYLISLSTPFWEKTREWLLRCYCHRTGKKLKETIVPLYRLRWALSRLWIEHHPFFSLAFSTTPNCSN